MAKEQEHSRTLDNWEHNADASAKRVVLRGQDPTSGDFVNVSVVESTATPGVYGLVVLNADGSAVSAGGAVAVDNLLLETGDQLLLETGDAIILDA